MIEPAMMAALEAKVTELGSAKAAAAYFAISEAYLSQIRNGHKAMPEWVGIALGFRRVWVRMGAVDAAGASLPNGQEAWPEIMEEK